MDNESKFLLIILALIYLGYIWGVPKTDIWNAIVTLVVVAITAGILFKKKKKKEA